MGDLSNVFRVQVSSANKAHIQSAVRVEVNARSEETATNDM